jgi:hypothetical protein
MAAPGTSTETQSVTGPLEGDPGGTTTPDGATVEGVLVVGAPESGCPEVGNWLQALGCYPVDSNDGFRLQDSADQPFQAPTLVPTPWSEFLLSLADGSWDLPPGADRLVQVRGDFVPAIRLRLKDAVDCSGGFPIVLSDEHLLPLLPALGTDTLSRFVGLLVLRNPLAIARTLSSKYDIALSEGLCLWEHYMAAAFSTSRSLPMLATMVNGAQTSDVLTLEAFTNYFSPAESPDRPTLAVEVPAELDWLDATDGEFRSVATSHQTEIWDFLVDAAHNGRPLQGFPDTFGHPTDAATEVLRDGARHRMGRVSKQKLSSVLSEERATQESLMKANAELQDLLASATDSLNQSMAERDQMRENQADLMQRLRTMGLTQAEGHRRADRLAKELEELHERMLELVGASEELEKVYQSEIWRTGYAITLPFRRLKEALFGDAERF